MAPPSPFGPYCADILRFSEKLVIEVDGDTHVETLAADAARARFMARDGYRTLRVANADVMQNLDGVIASISLSLREKEGARRVSGGKDEDSIQKKGSTT